MNVVSKYLTKSLTFGKQMYNNELVLEIGDNFLKKSEL